MRSFYSYIFLSIILNTVLFHPFNTSESNAFLTELDPVNSITEFVMEICLEIQDVHPGDERDGETEQFSHALKLTGPSTNSYIHIQKPYSVLRVISLAIVSISFPEQNFVSITSPPPEWLS